MNVEKLRQWLEVVGIFGLIVSLFVVVMEMRQSQRIALSSIYQARSDSSMVLRMAQLESETLLTALSKKRGGKVLTAEEEGAIQSLVSGTMIYLENMHYQYTEGFISEEHWQTSRAEMRLVLRNNPGIRDRATRRNLHKRPDSKTRFAWSC